MIAIRTSLARHVPAQPLDDDEIAAKAGAAWRERGWVCIRIDDIRSEWLRRGMEAEMNARYGQRRGTR